MVTKTLRLSRRARWLALSAMIAAIGACSALLDVDGLDTGPGGSAAGNAGGHIGSGAAGDTGGHTGSVATGSTSGSGAAGAGVTGSTSSVTTGSAGSSTTGSTGTGGAVTTSVSATASSSVGTGGEPSIDAGPPDIDASGCMPQDVGAAPPLAGCDIDCPLPNFCCGKANTSDTCLTRTAANISDCINPEESAPVLCISQAQCCAGTVCCAFVNGSDNWPTVWIAECVPLSECPSPNIRLCDPDAPQCEAGESCQPSAQIDSQCE